MSKDEIREYWEEKRQMELEKKDAPVETVVRMVEKTVLALDLETRLLVPMHVFEVIE